MRSPLFFVITLGILLVLDLYIFQAVKVLTTTSRYRQYIYYAFWLVSLLCILGLLLFVFTDPDLLGRKIRMYIFAFVVMLFLSKLIAVVFLITDDLRRIALWTITKGFSAAPEKSEISNHISRSAFLSWLGLAAGSTLFGTMVYGFSNKYNYTLKRLQLSFSNLPASFKGFKILQISDIHSGSLTDINAVAHGVQMIMKQEADLILFTGDLVNDRAGEMKVFLDLFSKLSAPMGVFSILGNHDYGDYVHWPYHGITKAQNLENIKKIHAKLGWHLLLNEHVILEREGEKIALLGIENWSAKSNFPSFGKLDEAYKGTEHFPFKILMSHDPSHWDAEVRPKYPDIDLMLSGHTHGMQFGVELPGVKWSPVQYMYKQWAGLYEEANQKLYVNRGFGFIGYPGRVGILPEITIIEFS